MAFSRRRTRSVRVGSVTIGGEAPISVQSMTNTNPHDADATLRQIEALTAAGCEIVRMTVPDEEAVQTLRSIRARTTVPLVADIHFDYRLALGAIDAGVDKVRINPGNIGDRRRVAEVAAAAATRGIPIRIGVNAGSLEKGLLEKYGGPTAEALSESALGQARLLEELGFGDIVISAKTSGVARTIDTYRLIAQACDYPLHIGVTESGTAWTGSIRSAVGMGVLLAGGIGDTMRVSLAGDPVPEVRTAFDILKALEIRQLGPVVIACPTCGRTRIDIERLAREVEIMVQGVREPLHLAVMGCAVNGPGEAREADLGIAGGLNEGLIFRKGRILGKVPADELLSVFKQELDNLLAEIRSGEKVQA